MVGVCETITQNGKKIINKADVMKKQIAKSDNVFEFITDIPIEIVVAPYILIKIKFLELK